MNEKYDILKIDNQFCFSVYALSKEITRLYKPFLKKIDLTYTQYITMLVLWETDELNVNEIGKRVSLDSGTLTPLLKKLEEKGLLNRERQKNDERNLTVTLTEKGGKLKDIALEIPVKLLEEINVNPEKIIELRDTLKKLNNEMSKI